MHTNSSSNSNHVPSNIKMSTSTTAPPVTATTSNLPSSLPLTSAPGPTKDKWVKNLSSRPLTKVDVSIYSIDPNITVVPLYSPKGDHISAVE